MKMETPSSSGLTSPNGLINIPAGYNLLEDPEEDVLEVCMSTPASGQNTSGAELGYVNSTDSILEFDLVLTPPTTIQSSNGDAEVGRRGRKIRKEKAGKFAGQEVRIPLRIQQDLGLLGREKGDTGSVLWRSSLYLAQHILTQHQFKTEFPLFNPNVLSEANILELGAGTGMLAIALSSLCQSYTASDLLLNLKVVSRNLLLNNKPDVHLEEIDWVDISSNPPKTNPPVNDLILAVDCIYNEYLASPLVDTLSYYCPNGSKTVVLVVVELRSPDVLTTFLQKWIEKGSWVIHRLPNGSLGDWGDAGGSWVGYVGWRTG